jgi:hypothetical protein
MCRLKVDLSRELEGYYIAPSPSWMCDEGFWNVIQICNIGQLTRKQALVVLLKGSIFIRVPTGHYFRGYTGFITGREGRVVRAWDSEQEYPQAGCIRLSIWWGCESKRIDQYHRVKALDQKDEKDIMFYYHR